MTTQAVPAAPAVAGDRRVPPVLRRLGWISLLTDAATEMLYPVLPVFLTVTLGAPTAALGLIEGVADGTANGLRVVTGYVTDRSRRLKPLIVTGYAASALAKPLLAFAPGWGFVLALRVGDRFGKAVRGVPRDLMIAEVMPPEQMGRAIGYHRMMDSTGAVVGPLLGLAALTLLGDTQLRSVFLLAFIPAGITVLLAATLPPILRTSRAVPLDADPATLGRGGPALPWRSPFGRFALAVGLFGLANSSDAFLLLRAHQLGMSPASIVLAYALFNLVDTLVSRPAGARSDRLGRLVVFRWGVLVFASVYLGFALAPSSAYVWPLMVVYGAYKGLAEGASRAAVFDLTRPEVHGRALGVTQAIKGTGVLVASVTAGFLFAVSPAAPFALGAGLALLAWIAVPRLRGPAAAVA